MFSFSPGGFGQADIEMKEVSNSTEVYNNNNSPVMFGPQLPAVDGKQPTECIDITEEEEVAENIGENLMFLMFYVI